MDVKVTWDHGLSFNGENEEGFRLPIGTDVSVGGENDGFRPMQLLLLGVGGCTGLDVISILKKKQQDVTGLEIKVHGDRVMDHPRIFNHIEVEYIITGHNVDRAAVQRAVELSETKYCSAQAMLSKAAQITHKITILEA